MSKDVACPVKDCGLAIDVVLKSSDGELFGAHQRNLETHTEGFPIAGSTVASDPVLLEETAEVLRLVLGFTHNVRSVNLDTINFTLLASLAEAVEKYMIYAPMEICRILMSLAINNHPNEVFLYSVKHNYPELADEAAKLTLKHSASDFVDLIRKAGCDDGIVVRWFCYRDHWMKILFEFLEYPWALNNAGTVCTNSHWYPFRDSVFREVSGDLSALMCILCQCENRKTTKVLRSLDAIFAVPGRDGLDFSLILGVDSEDVDSSS